MPEELKPCAKCKRNRNHVVSLDTGGYMVVCFCRHQGKIGRTKQEAISAWNKRDTP